MNKGIITTAVLAVVLALVGCINIYNPPATPATPTTPATPATPVLPTVPIKPVPAAQMAQFEDRTWVLEQYGQTGSLKNSVAGVEVTAYFDSASHRVYGNAGCNSYNAEYQRTFNKLAVSNMISTKMACAGPGLMDQEIAFGDMLSGAESCKTAGSNLEVNCTLNRLLVFKPK